eukprot:COSAG01_NODE_7095_length_3355_cov_2.836916_4_plen_319_part_00
MARSKVTPAALLLLHAEAAADGSRLVFMTEGRDAAIDTQPHSIIDLRCLGSTSLLTEGYAMLPHHSNVDLALLAPHMDGPHTPGYLREVRCAREEYKLEMEALARVALCGQRLKMVMAGEGLFTRRSDVARNSPERVKRGGPVPASGVVHSDLGAGHGEHFGRSLWAHADGQRRLRRAGLTAEELRRCRLVILQLWRPISSSRPVERDPLAVLDPRTLSAQDLFGTGLHERDPADQGGLNPARFAVHNAEHRWVHISAQRKDEVLVYAGYDSGRQPMLPLFHTSVTVPFERAGVPEARASVDAVVFCWIDESATTLAA